MEWAAYPFVGAAGARGCTDYYCFVNAQRHDLGTHRITIPVTGFLGPMDSMHGDTTLYNGTGWSRCWNQSYDGPNTEAERLKMAKTCWEHYDPPTFLNFITAQSGPGGTLQVDNEDQIEDDEDPTSCGDQIDINGNRFVDPAQRPASYNAYFARMVSQVAAANAPLGAAKHKVLVYTNNYASTGVNDSVLFADSVVLDRHGQQQAYINCTAPGGPVRTQVRKTPSWPRSWANFSFL
jgi:hypothetical protein